MYLLVDTNLQFDITNISSCGKKNKRRYCKRKYQDKSCILIKQTVTSEQ